MKIVHAMMVVQGIKIAHTMRVVQVMKIAHTMMVVQIIKIAHAMRVVQVMKIMHALIVMQVIKTACAMKANKKIMNGRGGHKGRTDYAGERVMRPGTKLEDSFRDKNFQIFHRLQSLLINTSLSGHTQAASLPSPLHQFLTCKTCDRLHCTRSLFFPSTIPETP